MFKKENLTSTLLGVIMLVFVGLIVTNLFTKKDSNEPAVTSNLAAEGTFSIEQQPVLGDRKAPNEILVFSDYNCPHCRAWESDILPAVQKELIDTGKAYLAHVNFSVLGPNSDYAAVVSEIVAEKNPDHFWTFHSELIEGVAVKSRILEVAAKHLPSLTEKEIEALIDDKQYNNEFALDEALAKKYNLTGTPSVVVNGKALASPNYADILQAVNENGGK